MGDDQEVADALARLGAQDPAAADDAQAAIEWLVGDEGPGSITQERLQTFLWYGLPTKWLIDLDQQLAIVDALARALDLLGLSRYAGICRAATTDVVLCAYDRDPDEGTDAFRRAHAASGIDPPDLPEFEWGSTMRLQEAAALSSTADFLELAVAAGELVPGGQGWRTRQRKLVRSHLNAPRQELMGQSLSQAVLTERAEGWVNDRRSGTRRRVLAGVANRLLHPGPVPPATTGEPSVRFAWLLGHLQDGIDLTQRGNLNRAFVQAAADRFGWEVSRPPRSEDDLYDLHQLRRLAQRLRLARRSGRKLVLTSQGRRLLTDRDQLWRVTAGGVLAGSDFTVFSGELLLALVLDTASLQDDEVRAIVAEAATEEGFRVARTGTPPSGREVSWALAETTNLLRALGLLSAGASWHDRRIGLTDAGRATALEALRARATGPRSRAGR